MYFECNICGSSMDCTCANGYEHALKQNLKKEARERLIKVEKERDRLRYENKLLKEKVSSLNFKAACILSNSKHVRNKFENSNISSLTIKEISELNNKIRSIENAAKLLYDKLRIDGGTA